MQALPVCPGRGFTYTSRIVEAKINDEGRWGALPGQDDAGRRDRGGFGDLFTVFYPERDGFLGFLVACRTLEC